jgi:hypothetical protein
MATATLALSRDKKPVGLVQIEGVDGFGNLAILVINDDEKAPLA